MNRGNKEKPQDTLSSEERYSVVPLPHQAILPLDLLDKVVLKIEKTRDSKAKAGKDNFIYLISQLLYAESGQRMNGATSHGNGGRYRYYECKELRVDCEPLEKKVISHLKGLVKSDSRLEQLIVNANKNSQTALLEIENLISQKKKQLLDAQKKIEKLATTIGNDLMSDGGISDVLKTASKQASENRTALEQQIQNLVSQQQILSSKIQITLNDKEIRAYLNRFDQLTRVEQRTFLETVLEKITVKKDNKLELIFRTKGTELDPNRPRRGRSKHLEEKGSDCWLYGGQFQCQRNFLDHT